MFTTISPKGKKRDRRAAVLILAAVLLVTMFAFLAFAIDLGYISLTQTELQNAADASALAAAAYIPNDTTQAANEAKRFATMEHAGGKTIQDQSVNVEFGTWDVASRSFNAAAPGNAVRVTIERSAAKGGQVPLFFAAIFGKNSFKASAQAIAMTNPRDICFVVDLSGSMNDDSEPGWTTDQINNTFGASVGNNVMQNVYDDFGFGSFPGTTQHVGQPLGITQNTTAYATLSSSTGPLTGSSIPTFYKITSSDNTAALRKIKAYRWMIDYQLAVIMPNALPAPVASNTASYNYWTKYLDYVIYPQPTGASSSNAITGFGNPQTSSYPDATTAAVQAFRNKLGYRTYTQFMMDYGREKQPLSGVHTELSRSNGSCPYHSEATDGGTFSFPPREMPTHATRRSIIAALQIVKERNANVSDTNERDWISIVTFDKAAGVTTLHPLDYNYDQAMQNCTTMQAVSDDASSTATENGLIAAKNLLNANGRAFTDKVVVMLTDGIPNLYSSSTSAINTYISQNPSPTNFYSGTSSYPQNAALMQSMSMQSQKWRVFPVGIGLGCNYDFMDRAARLGGTADAQGQSARGSGDPTEYEQKLKDIFDNIINNPKARLVQ